MIARIVIKYEWWRADGVPLTREQVAAIEAEAEKLLEHQLAADVTSGGFVEAVAEYACEITGEECEGGWEVCTDKS